MSILFTALPYLPPSLILPILPCIPLCMPSLAFSSALARLSQQNPWKHQPRVGRGRGARLSLCPHGGQGKPAGLQGPLVAAGSRGTCGDIPASRTRDGEGAPTYSIPREAAAPALLPEEGEGETRTFFSPGLDEESRRGIFQGDACSRL